MYRISCHTFCAARGKLDIKNTENHALASTKEWQTYSISIQRFPLMHRSAGELQRSPCPQKLRSRQLPSRVQTFERSLELLLDDGKKYLLLFPKKPSGNPRDRQRNLGKDGLHVRIHMWILAMIHTAFSNSIQIQGATYRVLY